MRKASIVITIAFVASLVATDDCLALRSVKNLRSLQCASILVEDLSTNAQRLGIRKEEIEISMLVSLKARLPRLRIDSGCSPSLYIALTILEDKTVGGEPLGFTAYMNFEVSRMVLILSTGENGYVPVWSNGYLFTGPLTALRRNVMDQIEARTTNFAADYYKAGNT